MPTAALVGVLETEYLKDMVPAGALMLLAAIAAPEPAAEGAWYGYETLVVDAASLTTGAVAFSHRGDLHAGQFPSISLTLGLAAGAAFVFGPAIVHNLHGRGAAAERSLILRLGLLAAAALISLPLYGAGWGGCGPCVYAIPVVGAAAIVAPIIIDAQAHDDASPTRLAFRF